MVSKVLSSVCLLCVVLLPVVWANQCRGFSDTNGDYVESIQCHWDHCCGSCNVRYCCDDKSLLLTEEQQALCPESNEANVKMKSKHMAALTGSIIGSVLLVLFIVLVITCCLVPCCLCYKWRKRRQRNVVNTTTVIHVPPSVPPSAHYQPSYPDYHPVPLQPGGTMSFPTAPPSYLEGPDPSCSPPPVDHGQMPPYPTYPQPTDEQIQLPYNPAYCPNP